MEPGLRVGGESQLSQIYEVTAEVTEELKRSRLIREQMRGAIVGGRGGVKWDLGNPVG